MELGELTSLRMFFLSNNPFNAGMLPTSFENLTNLVAHLVDWCKIIGDFPSSVVRMSELEQLVLETNSLTGSIHPEVWASRS